MQICYFIEGLKSVFLTDILANIVIVMPGNQYFIKFTYREDIIQDMYYIVLFG